jgi:hypothetical protein
MINYKLPIFNFEYQREYQIFRVLINIQIRFEDLREHGIVSGTRVLHNSGM